MQMHDLKLAEESAPRAAIELAQAVRGYVFYDTGASIVEIERAHKGSVHGNMLLLYGEEEWLCTSGRTGWCVVGRMDRLRGHPAASGVVLPDARQLVHACIHRWSTGGQSLLESSRTASVCQKDGGYLNPLGRWNVQVTQERPTGTIHFELWNHSWRDPSPQYGLVYVE